MKTLIKIMPVLMLTLAACSTPYLMVNQDLKKNAAAWEVKGRQGWMFNQKLSFGPYATGRVSRGWTKSYEVPFFVTFRGASEKFRFEQKGPNGSLMVHGVQKIRSKDIDILKGWLSIPIAYKDAFTGTIGTESQPDLWTFIVNNPNDQILGESSEGYLSNGQKLLQVKGVRQNNKNRDVQWGVMFGYEVWDGGRVVAGIETINKGRVWIDRSLNAGEAEMIAAFASAMLLRSELESRQTI